VLAEGNTLLRYGIYEEIMICLNFDVLFFSGEGVSGQVWWFLSLWYI
jgi:hypothetical protein